MLRIMSMTMFWKKRSNGIDEGSTMNRISSETFHSMSSISIVLRFVLVPESIYSVCWRWPLMMCVRIPKRSSSVGRRRKAERKFWSKNILYFQSCTYMDCWANEADNWKIWRIIGKWPRTSNCTPWNTTGRRRVRRRCACIRSIHRFGTWNRRSTTWQFCIKLGKFGGKNTTHPSIFPRRIKSTVFGSNFSSMRSIQVRSMGANYRLKFLWVLPQSSSSFSVLTDD